MTTELKGTPDSVLHHLTEALGGATPLLLTSTVEDRLADGSLIRKYTAYAEGVPNKTVAVALSASGDLLDLAAADRLAGRRLFVPDFAVGRGASRREGAGHDRSHAQRLAAEPL